MSFSDIPKEHSSVESLADEVLESEGLLGRSQTRRPCSRRPFHPAAWFLGWVLSLLATAAITSVLTSRSISIDDFAVVDRMRSLSWYSPVYNNIDLHIDHKIPDGSLWWNESNIFRQDPSPEVDQAWEDLVGGSANRVFVSKDDWIKMGLDPAVGAQWIGDPTGNTYMAEINVFHLIHCVDVMRKGAFLDYYWYSRPINPLYWTHFYHCLDMLRQELMCLAPLDLSPLVWSEHQRMPFPYFTINRQCRRWEDVMRYRDQHQMSKEQLDLMLNATKPPHAKAIPIPAQAQKLLENIGRWKAMDPAKDFEYVKMSDHGRNGMDGLPPVKTNPREKYVD